MDRKVDTRGLAGNSPLQGFFISLYARFAFGQYAGLMMGLYQVWAEVFGGNSDC